MKEKMSRAGYDQGNMKPRVEDYQKPNSDFSQVGFNKTTDYVERQDRLQAREATDIKQQSYSGRYS